MSLRAFFAKQPSNCMSLRAERSECEAVSSNQAVASSRRALSSQRHIWNIMAVGKQYYIYIMTNSHNTVLYTGVTNNLVDESTNIRTA